MLELQRKYESIELPKEKDGYFRPSITRRKDVAQARLGSGMTHLFEWEKAA